MTDEARSHDDREQLRTILDRSLITTPLLNTLDAAQSASDGGPGATAPPPAVKIVIDRNFDYVGGPPRPPSASAS